MHQTMDRREFLKVSAAAGAVLVAGELFNQVGSTAQASVNIPEAEKIIITILTDNYYDLTVPPYKIASRYVLSPGSPIVDFGLHAEHGLSYHVETVVNGKTHSFLFDYGVDSQGVLRNMNLLKVDFTKIEALGLSHGHFDHQAALLDILKAKKSIMREGVPLYVGEETFVERFTRLMSGGVLSLGELKREDIEALKLLKIVEVKDPTPIVPGAYLSGKIEMVTEYEKGQPPLIIKRGDQFQQDFFVGEQAVVFNVRGKGLVVASGCAHRGIVNAVKQAQKISGIEKVYAVLGGFHLTGAKPEIIQRTIADIKTVGPDYIIPTHCTGFPAITAFAREMPDQFILSTVGTRFSFSG
jgi:7,8-dihydropterin-6-yl-methyl-4-(beta-D-ribofuranosyl)aminobenzene 5'-phosphate synthase